MIEGLKPCPFCGGKAYLVVKDGVRVTCGDCSASTKVLVDGISAVGKPYGCAVESVIESWNKRVGEENVDARSI